MCPAGAILRHPAGLRQQARSPHDAATADRGTPWLATVSHVDEGHGWLRPREISCSSPRTGRLHSSSTCSHHTCTCICPSRNSRSSRTRGSPYVPPWQSGPGPTRPPSESRTSEVLLGKGERRNGIDATAVASIPPHPIEHSHRTLRWLHERRPKASRTSKLVDQWREDGRKSASLCLVTTRRGLRRQGLGDVPWLEKTVTACSTVTTSRRVQNAVSRIIRGGQTVAGGHAALRWPVYRATARSTSAGCGDGTCNVCACCAPESERGVAFPAAFRTGTTDPRRHGQCGDEEERVGHAHNGTGEPQRPTCLQRACHYREHAVLTPLDRGKPFFGLPATSRPSDHVHRGGDLSS